MCCIVLMDFTTTNLLWCDSPCTMCVDGLHFGAILHVHLATCRLALGSAVLW